MDVERMQLHRAVLDDPVFHVPLPDDDIGLAGARVEWLGLLALDREHEACIAVRLGGVDGFLGEIELARPVRLHRAEPGKN